MGSIPATRANFYSFYKMNKVIDFVKDSFNELRYKVSWPKYNELQNNSVLVLVASLIFALVIGLMDLIFDNAMNTYYDLFK